jgi:hypothetical protein
MIKSWTGRTGNILVPCYYPQPNMDMELATVIFLPYFPDLP